MRLGVRGKLFLTSVVVIITAVAGSGLYLNGEIRNALEARIASELESSARMAREVVRARKPSQADEFSQLVRRLAKASAARITVVDDSGRVLADSNLSEARLKTIDNHADRPEIAKAFAADIGRSRRYSTTLHTDMLYVAVAFRSGATRGVVRAAKPLSTVDGALSQWHTLLFVAALVGLGIALAMSALAAHLVSREMRQLVQLAQEILPDDKKADISKDEVSTIAGSLNQLSYKLERALNKLAAERGRLEAVLEGMSEAVIALDDGAHIEFVNARALELLDLAQAPIGASMLETLRIPAVQDVTAAAHRGKSANAEFDLPGTGTRVLLTATPQRGGQGCILVFHDVTEVRRLERIRRDFVSNVSHELRTPVSVMRANAETLLGARDTDRARTQPILEAIVRHADRLSGIIGDLLDLSRLEAGRRDMRLETVVLCDIAERAVEVVSEVAASKEITITTDVAKQLQVLADRKALDQILVNLVDNAIKYSPQGSEIEIRVEAHGDQLRIAVHDEGPGVSADHRDRVFERFYRVDEGRSRDQGGTGLGLAIVKHLAEAMGGQVGLDVPSGGGSIFWVQLKRAPANIQTVDPQERTAK